MIKLANALDRERIPYIWVVFTDSAYGVIHPNIMCLRQRLDVIPFIKEADYLVQLSDKGEGYGYTPVEALSLGVPVIVTPCPSFLEAGIKNGENAFILDYDMNNINTRDIYEKRLKFDFKAKEDGWSNILVKGTSNYKEEKKMEKEVRAIIDFYDMASQTLRKAGDVWSCDEKRAKTLEENGGAVILDKEEVKEEKPVDTSDVVRVPKTRKTTRKTIAKK